MLPKVLVVVLYETREHEVTFEPFKKNLLERFNADLALCVGDGPREKPNPFYENAKYVWTFQESKMAGAKDWSAAFDEFSEGRDWRCLLPIPDSWMSGIDHPVYKYPGAGNMFHIFREFLRRSMVAANVLDAYDWFIITRSDVMYPLPHPPLELLSPRFIHSPDGERYNGFTDRHIVVPKRHIAKVLSISRDVFDCPEDLARRMKALDREWNVESFLKFRFGELGLLRYVRFFPYFMYLVRSPGGHTRWSPGTYNMPLRLFVKYPSEFMSSSIIQALVRNDEDWKHFIGWRRFLNWRMYAYALMRTSWERTFMPKRLQMLRALKRFSILMLQPIETGKLDRLR